MSCIKGYWLDEPWAAPLGWLWPEVVQALLLAPPGGKRYLAPLKRPLKFRETPGSLEWNT